MNSIFLAAFFVLISIPFSVPSQTKGAGKDEVEVSHANDEFQKAFQDENAVALETLLTDNFIWTHSTGDIQNKKLILENIRSGKLQYDFVGTDDVHVYLYKNSAVVSGHSTRRYPGKETFWLRYTAVYVKIGGKWKAAAFHSSHVPS